MAVKYKDYYEALGLDRSASQEDIQNAYRKLARKYHPDVNQSGDAEQKFKEINEAYEVLKDPEKRRKYDQLGANYQEGDEFRPPPGWEAFRDAGGGTGGFRQTFNFEDLGGHGFDFFGGSGAGGAGGFSDFFESLFGSASAVSAAHVSVAAQPRVLGGPKVKITRPKSPSHLKMHTRAERRPSRSSSESPTPPAGLTREHATSR